MSMDSVRPYFRTQINALGFEEWPDAFNFENIPSTNLNKAYHLEAGPIGQLQLDPGSNDVTIETTVRFFLRGYNDPIDALDDAYTQSQSIIEAVMDTTERSTQGSGFRNVRFTAGSFEPFADSNDNIIIGLLTFESDITICF